ncbi:MAG: alpha/beta hydrolase [Planctomycetaceae bacterium]|nr:alpha/beta hydrolase [Planctomycetaceae bacterium]
MSPAQRTFIVVAILFSLSSITEAQQRPDPNRKITYKVVGEVELQLHVFEPKAKAKEPRAAIVFFFGGGWNGGSPSQFYPHCRHLADQGMWAAAAEYRVNKTHGTTPFECVADGKSAIRFVRSHAKELHVDPNRIAASGGSAGGHVAAAVATVPGLDERGESQEISCRPNALVLFNPVYDNGPDGYGHSRVADRYEEISPMHNIRDGIPPAIVFLGTEDKLIPVDTAKTFQAKMKERGADSRLFLYEGQPHGFFNFGRSENQYYEETVAEMDEFLRDHGFLTKASD